MITDSYREQNRRLHASQPKYGTSGKRYVEAVRQLCAEVGNHDVLDYGCGKRLLEAGLGFNISNYDPCIEGLDQPPIPHDIVACTDVLEHIEPACLTAVLDDLRRCTLKIGFFAIHLGPALKFLDDGRNAHLIQETPRWWLGQLWEAGFHVRWFADFKHELHLIVE